MSSLQDIGASFQLAITTARWNLIGYDTATILLIFNNITIGAKLKPYYVNMRPLIPVAVCRHKRHRSTSALRVIAQNAQLERVNSFNRRSLPSSTAIQCG